MKSTAYSTSLSEAYGSAEIAHPLRATPTGPVTPTTFGSLESAPTAMDIRMRRRPAAVTLPSVSLTFSPSTNYTTTEEEIDYLFRIPEGTLWKRRHILGVIMARVLFVQHDLVRLIYPVGDSATQRLNIKVLDFLCRYERVLD